MNCPGRPVADALPEHPLKGLVTQLLRQDDVAHGDDVIRQFPVFRAAIGGQYTMQFLEPGAQPQVTHREYPLNAGLIGKSTPIPWWSGRPPPAAAAQRVTGSPGVKIEAKQTTDIYCCRSLVNAEIWD